MCDKMRVIHFRKFTWFLLAAFTTIFIAGNIMLFNKFMGRKNILQDSKQVIENMGKDMIIKHWKKDPNSPLGRVADLLNRKQDKQSNEGINLAELDGKTTTSPLQQQQEMGEQIQDKKQTQHEKQPVTIKHEGGDNNNNGVAKTNNENDSAQPIKKTDDSVIAVLVISCNRPEYVKRCLNRLLEYRPSAEKFPIIVSQDCGHRATADVIRSYGDKIAYIQQPQLGNVKGVPANMIRFMGYYKISRHFRFALGKAFDDMKFETVLIVEDDLEIAPDFFEYFEATRPLLTKDPSLWCISTWNDNGKESLVQNNDLLFRTDFFPGLGWMLSKRIWMELKPKWPLGFWDDWMRQPDQRKGRACIRPDIPRTKTYGKVGVSQGQFYEQHLKFIKLNDKKFPFLQSDMSYLIKENYDPEFKQKISHAPLVNIGELMSGSLRIREAKVEYSNEKEFERLAKQLGAMTDFKSGVARASYKGVVTVMHKRTRVYLIPEKGIS